MVADIREKLIKKVREKLVKAVSRDKILVYSVGLVEDMEKIINLLYERLTDLYSIYFPELKTDNREKFCKVVIAVDKENLEETKRNLEKIPDGDEIYNLLINSKGIDLTSKDLREMKDLANLIINLIKEKEKFEAYNDSLVREVAPNLSEVAGSKIAAKLIAKAGGLKKLANFPASTIQVLGAEKALFKHLKKGTKPPKHGIIFQHPDIRSSKKEYRGKIARVLSSKLSIAAKVDYYSKKFIGKELKEKFEKRVKEIKGIR